MLFSPRRLLVVGGLSALGLAVPAQIIAGLIVVVLGPLAVNAFLQPLLVAAGTLGVGIGFVGAWRTTRQKSALAAAVVFFLESIAAILPMFLPAISSDASRHSWLVGVLAADLLLWYATLPFVVHFRYPALRRMRAVLLPCLIAVALVETCILILVVSEIVKPGSATLGALGALVCFGDVVVTVALGFFFIRLGHHEEWRQPN